MDIRTATHPDFGAIWPFFKTIVAAGETYAYDPGLSKADARQLWLDVPQKTFVVEDNQQILGSYYIKTNQAGPGSHVCNCGFMVSPQARGRGVATLMCEHAQKIARQLGYRAMQFNSVVCTNEGAIRLWHKMGFETVGRVPNAFNHPEAGYVDSLIMYKWLD